MWTWLRDCIVQSYKQTRDITESLSAVGIFISPDVCWIPAVWQWNWRRYLEDICLLKIFWLAMAGKSADETNIIKNYQDKIQPNHCFVITDTRAFSALKMLAVRKLCSDIDSDCSCSPVFFLKLCCPSISSPYRELTCIIHQWIWSVLDVQVKKIRWKQFAEHLERCPLLHLCTC